VQPDGTSKEKKAYIWGYGSGVAASTNPLYGDVVLAAFTLPFNEGDVTSFTPLYIQTVAMLTAFPIPSAADAAYDARSRLPDLCHTFRDGRHSAQPA
jgi:hypothetical protein